MAMTQEDIKNLDGYLGLTPCPEDFDQFWAERMAQADAVPLEYTITQAREVPSFDTCRYLDPSRDKEGAPPFQGSRAFQRTRE